MPTLHDNSRTDAPPDGWQQALAGFRARAKKLFEAQQERVRSLERTIAEHVADEGPAGSQAADEANAAGSARQEQELRTQLAQSRKLLNVRAEELKRLRAQIASAGGQPASDAEPLLEQVSELRMERDQLVARLADAEHTAQRASAGDAAELDELRRRFERAVQEIRELKTRNAELEAGAARNASAQQVSLPAAGNFDWEEQKRQLMEELDGDQTAGKEVPKADRLSIESTIRITDEVVASKDREIADLRARMHGPGAPAGGASDAVAVTELLDRDEVIQAEREKLSQLQNEWREKLRHAEIEASLERAKLARERADLDERVRTFEAQRAAFTTNGNASTDAAATKPQSGRWLSRLGLKDNDD
jgi:hypothetical protein